MNSRAHFRIFGVPVRVEPFFVIVAVLFGMQLEPLWLVFAWVLITFLAILIHELGHAFTFRAFGQRSAVVLHGFGGFTVPTGGRVRLSRGKSIVVSLSGAIVQLLVVWLPARFASQTDWAQAEGRAWAFSDDFSWWPILEILQFVGLWWAVFNLLPIRPLDGGHVSEELIGFENACRVSIAAAAVAAFVAYREFTFFGLLFFALLGFLNFRDLREGRHATAFDIEAPQAAGGGPPGKAGKATPRNPLRKPSRRRGGANLQVVRPPGGGPVPDLTPRPRSGESESLAWNALRSGDGAKASSIIERAGGGVNPFLRASAALLVGPAEMADDLFESAYRTEPGGPPNLVPATLLADQGRAVAVASRLVEAKPEGLEAAGGLQTHLHYAERFRAAAEVGEKVFEAGPRSKAQTAFEVACSWARAGNADVALRWVGIAVDAGFRAPGLLDSEPDLAPVRSLPGWAAVRSRLSA